MLIGHPAITFNKDIIIQNDIDNFIVGFICAVIIFSILLQKGDSQMLKDILKAILITIIVVFVFIFSCGDSLIVEQVFNKIIKWSTQCQDEM